MKKIKEETHYLRSFFIYFALFCSLVLIYARYIGTTGLVVREYVIESPKLTSNFNGLKMVHFSDLHYGTTVLLPELKNLVAEINRLKPDIIVFTGDMIDIDYKIKGAELDNVISLLNELQPTIASYIIKGNHDQGNRYNKIIEKTAFNLLNNTHELLYYNGEAPLLVVGLDDLYVGKQDIEAAYTGLEENDYYTILLAHEPDVISKFENNKPDMFLAGHSHNGQVRLPFLGAVVRNKGALSYYEAYYKLEETEIFISGGLGTRKIPLRLFNRPSFNFYRFFAE